MSSDGFIVDRDDFYKALNMLLILAKGKNPPDLKIFVEDSKLVLQLGGMTHRLLGEGSIIGKAIIPGKAIRNLKRFLPDEEKIRVIRSPWKISFGSFRISCKWSNPSDNVEDNPPDFLTFLQILGLRDKYSLDMIQKLGLMSKYKKAEQRKHDLISKATDILSDFRIDYSQVEELVNNAIKKANRT